MEPTPAERMPEIPEPDHDDPKEVYAFYGLAMYTAQLLEHSILNLAVGLFMHNSPVLSRQVFDSAFTDLSRKTLGALLKAARSLTPIAGEAGELLSRALERRNYLTHHFFRAHADIFVHEQGRRLMLAELQAAIAEFLRADELVTPLYMAVWKRFGLDEGWVARKVEAIQVEVNKRFARYG